MEWMWFCPTIQFYILNTFSAKWKLLLLLFHHFWSDLYKKQYLNVERTCPWNQLIQHIGTERPSLLHKNYDQLPYEEQLWQRKHEKRKTLQTTLPVITVSRCHKNWQKHKYNDAQHETFQQIAHLLNEQKQIQSYSTSKNKRLGYVLMNKS